MTEQNRAIYRLFDKDKSYQLVLIMTYFPEVTFL